MGEPEILERFADRFESEASIEGNQIGLRSKHDRQSGIVLAAARQSLLHQALPEPAPAQRSGDGDPADAQRPRDQPDAAGKHTLGASQQMPCTLVEPVEVGIGAALLDDKDALPEAQQLIELACRQLLETPPFQ